jgi:UDP-glucose/GDP-mannose dehydrogenase family, NAD binding domain
LKKLSGDFRHGAVDRFHQRTFPGSPCNHLREGQKTNANSYFSAFVKRHYIERRSDYKTSVENHQSGHHRSGLRGDLRANALNEYREPDLRYLTATVKSIAPHVRAGQLVVLESTTYPGTTEELVLPLLENENPLKLCVSRDSSEARNVFFVAFSPEREDPGTTSICALCRRPQNAPTNTPAAGRPNNRRTTGRLMAISRVAIREGGKHTGTASIVVPIYQSSSVLTL